MRKVLIAGATGSIGQAALRAYKAGCPFTAAGLAAGVDREALEKAAKEFDCTKMALSSETSVKVFVEDIVCDTVLNAVPGFKGLEISVAALTSGKDLVLANKESIVAGAHILKPLAAAAKRKIIPVDSEHSAINALINAHGKDAVKEVIITASGGPFRTRRGSFETITPEEALRHPTWKMGPKVTLDSATLANKGLEVIEAARLFDLSPEKIRVAVHPQSIVHSMVVLKSGATYAQLSKPDMALPVGSALSDGAWQTSDYELPFHKLSLSFEDPDPVRFPMLALGFRAASSPLLSIIYNAADEAASALFLSGKIRFTDIPRLTESAMADSSLTKTQFPSTYEAVKSLHERTIEKTKEAACSL